MSDSPSAEFFPLAVANGARFDIFVTDEVHDSISRAIAEGRYRFPTPFNLLRDLVPPGGNVLDLGAQIGTFTLYAATLGHRVLAVEASPRNVALLEASVAKNKLTDVRVVSAAIGDRSGEVMFHPAGPFGLVAHPGLEGPTISVPLVTVDDLLVRAGWEKVDFVKLDIEGSEVAGLRGMSRLLSRTDAPLIAYESNGYTLGLFGETPQSLIAALEAFGYRCYLITEDGLAPVQPSDVQPECNVDCFAAKQLAPHAAWPVRARLSQPEVIAKIELSSRDPNKHVRQYTSRALGQPEAATLLEDRKIRAVLARLAADPEPTVREAAAWSANR